MSENEIKITQENRRTKRRLAKRIGAAGWGLFFIWMGASLLLDVGWGIGLVGIAAVIFLGQTARLLFGLRLESFWLAVGAFFLLGGIWRLYSIDIDLMPILLIVAGVVVFVSMFRTSTPSGWRSWCGDGWSRNADGWRCCSWPADKR